MGTSWRRIPALLMGICLASGCYNGGEVNAFLIKPHGPIFGTEYRVLPPDSIQISSLHVPEINGNHRIRPDGKINLPLLGEIYVTNMTPKEIESTLMTAAKDYYEQVDCTVQIASYSQKFYVFGQVGAEGPQTWTGHDSLLDALAQAQVTDSAWHSRIVLLRVSQPAVGGYASPETLQYKITGVHPEPMDKPRYKMLINMKAMTMSGDMANNVLLKPDDIIYVQAHPLAWVGMQIRRALAPVSPVLEAVRTPLYLQARYEDINNPNVNNFRGNNRTGF